MGGNNVATREVSVLQIEKIGSIQEQEDGSIAVTFMFGDGQEVGILMPQSAASELSGALIERSRTDHDPAHGLEGSGPDQTFRVRSAEELPLEEDTYVLRLSSPDGGPALTFRMGDRMTRRWRDMLTDQIVRYERRSKN